MLTLGFRILRRLVNEARPFSNPRFDFFLYILIPLSHNCEDAQLTEETKEEATANNLSSRYIPGDYFGEVFLLPAD